MKALLVSCICALVVLIGVTATVWAGHALPDETPMSIYISRPPIRINGDPDFTAANGVIGGSGTPVDPWVIEGWEISGQGHGHCIYIGNNTGHFVIRGCKLHHASGGKYATYYNTESGLILHNVQNGSVTGNNFYSNSFDGIYLHNSSHVLLAENVLSGNRWGIMLMDGSNNNTVRGNLVNASTDYGIGLIDSSQNRVEGNNASQNANMGIFLGDSSKNSIKGNAFFGNTDGIYLESSEGNTVSENEAAWNSGYGIYLWISAGNRLYHNNILGNAKQAHDDAGANSWDNGFPSGGNHWGDYAGIDANNDGMGDTAYAGISGGMGARDRYPFMGRWFHDTEPPVADAGPDREVNEGTVVTFNASASTDNVGVTTYTWAFRHGAREIVLNGVSPSHNFTAPGIYNITLEARDSAGNRGTDAMEVAVNDVTPPRADAGPNMEADEGAMITFNGSGSEDNVGITAYIWTFNDGTGDVRLEGVSQAHIFPMAGTYPVTLNVSDATGLWDTDTITVAVRTDTTPPVAVTGPSQAVAAGEAAVFNGSASTDNVGIVNYTWSFAHNSTAVEIYGVRQEHVFWTPGNYTVVLTVRDAAGNSGTDSLNITVNARVEASEGADPADWEADGEAGEPKARNAWLAVLAVIAPAVLLALYLKDRGRKQE